MSYNKQYNTRHSGRYNTPGQFVSAGEEMAQPPAQAQYSAPRQPPLPPTPAPAPAPAPQQKANHHANASQSLQALQSTDVEMKSAKEELSGNMSDTASNASAGSRPFWMKSKLGGVKKVSNKERRRRQNENLRRLLTPKNALMVLNEMLPNEQLGNQFTVESAGLQMNSQFYTSKTQPSFCADLSIKGHVYKGYGENKLTARNVAAEQAIRDLIIQKMNKALTADTASTGGGAAEGAGEAEGEEEPLPMIQLASFALHKLFSEWEFDGHKVPQLKPAPAAAGEAGAAGAGTGAGPGAPPAPRKPKAKELPGNAASMHPCMLLTYMRPHLEYRELAVEGDRPQNLLFTLGIDVDGSTYIGKASNKKEARKMAAKAACEQLFAVRFHEFPTDSAPQHAAA